jgi:hypothetical protein
MFTFALPLLVTLTDPAWFTPTFTLPKLIDDEFEVSDTFEPTPVPLSGTDFEVAEVEIPIDPESLPELVGLNSAVKVVLLPAPRV